MPRVYRQAVFTHGVPYLVDNCGARCLYAKHFLDFHDVIRSCVPPIDTYPASLASVENDWSRVYRL